MAEWLEHTVHVDVDTPVETVWQLWSDISQMPNWMKWISSVEVLEEQPELSRWRLETAGLSFSWLSRIVKVVPQQIIQWESVDGLPNKGAIRFYGHKSGGSTVKMSIAYALPSILARLMMSSSFVDRVVTSTLQADLDRFREYAIAHCAQSSDDQSSDDQASGSQGSSTASETAGTPVSIDS
ncbi:MAG: SRPBCC family protein [Cyanobacteria bacterium J06648_10]